MKVIVTGSEGFVGSKLVPKLIKEGHEVIPLDIEKGCDITDWSQIKKISNFDALIHLAAITFVPKSYEMPREMYETNINGTLNTLELCRANKAKMIFVSSYVYGEPQYLPIDENHPISSHNPYCQSKIMAEKLCEGYHDDFRVPVIIFRPFNIYGPGQDKNFLIPTIKKQIEENGRVFLKDPRPKRDYVHVLDVVNAYIRAIEYCESEFEIFNIGSGESYSVKEIADLIINNISKKVELEFSDERRKNEVLDTVADISRAKEKLGWNPEVNLEVGIRKTLEN